MSEIRVRQVEQGQAEAWSDTLAASATFTALNPWCELVQQTYGYTIHRFEAVEDNELTGVLVLVHVRHPIFGNYLATSPFGSYGGFAFKTIAARDALLHSARQLSDELKVEYAVVRFIADDHVPSSPWLQQPLYSTYLIDLPADAGDLMERFGSQHRKHTRQSLKKGFQIRFGQLELLEETYEALARSMHDLGSPYHSKEYLRKMAELLGGQLEFVLIKDAKGSLAGSAVLIYQGDVASNLHANILREFRSDYAGEFLYWSMLEHYCQKGMRICDMGRSLNDSGNETFKLKWRPRKVPLAYWYYLPKGGEIPELNQKSPKFRFAIWMWKRLPAFVVRRLGPSLIRGIA